MFCSVREPDLGRIQDVAAGEEKITQKQLMISTRDCNGGAKPITGVKVKR